MYQSDLNKDAVSSLALGSLELEIDVPKKRSIYL